MSIHTIEFQLPGNSTPIEIQTGKIALLANASVVLTQGGTKVLITVCNGEAREGMNFFPLQVAYRENYYSTGKIPQGYFKREGRPSEREILTARMTDRPIRPLFPKGFYHDVQIFCTVLSADKINNPDTLAMLGSSFALSISDLPFNGPFGAVRVGLIKGDFVANPTHEQMEDSSLELIYAGLEDKTIMIEGDCDELSEEQLRDALSYANEQVKVQITQQRDFQKKINKAKKEYSLISVDEEIYSFIKEKINQEKLEKACFVSDRRERDDALSLVLDEIKEQLVEKFSEEKEALWKDAYNKLYTDEVRNLISDKGVRSDGRGVKDLREITAEIDFLDNVHGSAIFSRGETQALVVSTLGSADSAQRFDDIVNGEGQKNFYLHYNFPNYSVGETGRIMGPGNREIGHGNLAERSIKKMMPKDYPYVVRSVSDVMGSNGSTSMASICGASLSLFAAGVALKKSVAGISCGLVKKDNDYTLIADILGSEDHYGDMDFKIAGTKDGITGFQLDLKIDGVPIDIMYEAMKINLENRIKILNIMDACIGSTRTEVSPSAPQIVQVKIDTEKIGAVIGTGGKEIKNIIAVSQCKVDIEDDGTINIFGENKQAIEIAKKMIDELTFEVVLNEIYRGTVIELKDFGAIVELGKKSGLLHISELADFRVESVEDICQVGDEISVKVIEVDNRTGRFKLSRKRALEEI